MVIELTPLFSPSLPGAFDGEKGALEGRMRGLRAVAC